MKPGLLFPSLAVALLALLPAVAWADQNPDFENDALPILKHQPGLVQYVHAHYAVQETGIAQSPGTADQAPQPPYIFNAKPRGTSGPFYLRLLIQPGEPGHILKVADIRKLPGGAPPQETVPAEASAPTASETAPPEQPASDQPPANPASAPASSSSIQPSSSTPSGPIRD
jgi:hypothetical protein